MRVHFRSLVTTADGERTYWVQASAEHRTRPEYGLSTWTQNLFRNTCPLSHHTPILNPALALCNLASGPAAALKALWLRHSNPLACANPRQASCSLTSPTTVREHAIPPSPSLPLVLFPAHLVTAEQKVPGCPVHSPHLCPVSKALSPHPGNCPTARQTSLLGRLNHLPQTEFITLLPDPAPNSSQALTQLSRGPTHAVVQARLPDVTSPTSSPPTLTSCWVLILPPTWIFWRVLAASALPGTPGLLGLEGWFQKSAPGALTLPLSPASSLITLCLLLGTSVPTHLQFLQHVCASAVPSASGL
ncbi:uncharacterized protein [Equus asinus]|uniref:uncharacterized protein n=1 Tax=Equus asinus TaxID=9793 RepID=UPI0038F6BF41